MSIGQIKDDVSAYPQTQDGASGSYDQHPWNQANQSVEPNKYQAPTNTWEQVAIRQATIVATMPRKQVQRLVKPPLPQIGPRPRKPSRPVDIYDCVSLERQYADQRAYFSGSPAGFSGSPRNEGTGWGGPY